MEDEATKEATKDTTTEVASGPKPTPNAASTEEHPSKKRAM